MHSSRSSKGTKRVFVAGNPLLKLDSISLRVARALKDRLPGVKFKRLDSLSELKSLPRELWLIDAAKGIDRVQKISSIRMLAKPKSLSLHDFDLAAELLLYKRLGKLKGFAILAVPFNYDEGRAVKEVEEIIKRELLSKKELN